MERIAVVGCVGAGKSTVARVVGRTLGIEVLHLDRYWWKPGRYRVIGPATVAAKTIDRDEFRQLEEQIVALDRWVIDGDAANKDLRLARADTVVFLDLPRWRCILGLVRRHLTNSYDYPDDVQGSWRWVVFLARWVWTTWPSERRPSLVAAISEHASTADVPPEKPATGSVVPRLVGNELTDPRCAVDVRFGGHARTVDRFPTGLDARPSPPAGGAPPSGTSERRQPDSYGAGNPSAVP